jgi:hypothetical protein
MHCMMGGAVAGSGVAHAKDLVAVWGTPHSSRHHHLSGNASPIARWRFQAVQLATATTPFEASTL